MRGVIAGLGLWFMSLGAASAATCSPDSVQLKNDHAQIQFSIEVADSQPERSRGLMFRDHLARNAGMLFVFERPQRVAFWMKNTLIPLDMIFVDETGIVSRVHHGAIPGDETPIQGGDSVFAVLEINAGLARRYGISKGTMLRHEVFSKGPAAWSC